MRCSRFRNAALVLLLACAFAASVAGCGRGSMVGRRVGDFSAYYNTFYNARQAFEEGTQAMGALERPVDQGAYLPVFVEPAQVGAEDAFERTIEKSADLLRTHPRSKWVDDALLLIGKAYFYQENYVGAERKFREVIERGAGPLAGEARFWLGRTLLSSGRHAAAEEHLTESLQSSGVPERWAARMRLLRGDLQARQGAWASAAEALAQGLRGTDDDQARARAHFLRGQVLEAAGRHAEAAEAYRSAAGERPRYELAYAAKTSALRMAARASAGGSGGAGNAEAAASSRAASPQAAAVQRQLRRLERDDKNEAKRAELALLRAELYQAQGRAAQARQQYAALLYPGEERGGVPAPSAEVRGRAHYALGTLYRDAFRDFTRAAAHFDTAATTLSAPAQTASASAAAGGVGRAAPPAAYAITDSRRQAERYGRVAEAAGAVARFDSLLRLGEMSQDDFDTFVDSLRRARAQAERSAQAEETRRRAERRFGQGRAGLREGRSAQAEQQLAAAQAGPGAEASFLFHRDPGQVQQGLRGFLRRWGQRPRVPNWRRREAVSTQADADVPGEPTQTVGPEEELPAAGLPRVDVSAVPRDPEQLRALRTERAARQYDLGNALFLAAERPDSAAVWFRRVLAEGVADTPVMQRARYALAEAERAAGGRAEATRSPAGDARAGDSLAQGGAPPPRRGEPQQQQQGGGSAASPAEKAKAKDAYARAYRRWQSRGAQAAALEQMLDVAATYPETPAAPRALLAAARIFVEWTRRTERPLTAPLPVRRLPEALRPASAGADAPLAAPADSSATTLSAANSLTAGSPEPDSAAADFATAASFAAGSPADTSARSAAVASDAAAVPPDTAATAGDPLATADAAAVADTAAVSDTASVSGTAARADSAAAADTSGASARDQPSAATLERLLTVLVRRYPATPHAERAKQMLSALRERYPQRVAARPDSLSRPGENERRPPSAAATDAAATDAAAAGSTAAGPAAADSARTGPRAPRSSASGSAAPSAAPGLAESDSAATPGGAPPAALAADTLAADTLAADPAAASETDVDTAGRAAAPANGPPARPDSTPAQGAGAWTIVVASMRQQSQAEAAAGRVREQLRQHLSGQPPPEQQSSDLPPPGREPGETTMPVRVVAPASRGEQQRYRVGVGRFASRAAGEAALQRHAGALPPNSWLWKAPASSE